MTWRDQAACRGIDAATQDALQVGDWSTAQGGVMTVIALICATGITDWARERWPTWHDWVTCWRIGRTR